MRLNRTQLWTGLLLTSGLIVVLAPPPGGTPGPADVVQPTARRAPVVDAARADESQRSKSITTTPTVLRIASRPAEPDAGDDGSGLWLRAEVARPASAPRARPITPMPAPPPVAPAPIAPALPALPFRLLGRYADAGRAGVILQGADGQVLIAHAGEKLAEQYRVDAIAGNAMMLTYLPLNLPQSMDIGISP